jgi:hypothetical protein
VAALLGIATIVLLIRRLVPHPVHARAHRRRRRIPAAGRDQGGAHPNFYTDDTDTPAMAPAHDPIGALVLSADTSAVDSVLVGGRIVKRDGRLLHHDVASLLTTLAASAAHLAGDR